MNCPKCGTPNKCAMEAGKSPSACWCMGYPSILEIYQGEPFDGCLCETCMNTMFELHNHIQSIIAAAHPNSDKEKLTKELWMLLTSA